MAYRIEVADVGAVGAPRSRVVEYQADTAMEAMALAGYEVDAHRTGPQRLATVFDPAGVLVLAYAGRRPEQPDDGG